MAIHGISPIRFETVSAVTATPSVELGTRVTDTGIDYVYCYNAGAASITQGKMGRISSGNSGYSVSVTNAASQAGGEFVVGVAHNAAIAAGSYGWLATRGAVLGAVDASEVSMNVGDIAVAGVDGGFVVKVGTSATGVPLGFVLNSFVTTVGTGKLMFKSPLFG